MNTPVKRFERLGREININRIGKLSLYMYRLYIDPGTGRLDLAVEYHKRIYIIEIKLVHTYDRYEEIYDEGKRQITRYRDKIDGNAPAYLVIFDRRTSAKEKPWEDRPTWERRGTITVLGC